MKDSVEENVKIGDEKSVENGGKKNDEKNRNISGENLFAGRKSLKNPDLAVFKKTKNWLDIYFGGGVPDFCPEFSIDGETDFQKEVAAEMLKIPYGKSVCYGFIADRIAQKRKIKKMSAQAVGCAAKANRICLIIPCHRVTGKNGELTGYGGGINNKKELLKLEKIEFN